MKISNIVEKLKLISKSNPDLLSHCIISKNEILESYTYKELDQKARSIAGFLQAKNLNKERVIIALPQSLDFISAFLGCLYAGVIAVPAYPPFNQKQTLRIKAVAKDSQANYIIANEKIANLFKVKDNSIEVDNFDLINIDHIKESYSSDYKEISINDDDIAFLQYTSGSTGTPKGVVVNHENIFVNIGMIGEVFKDTTKDIFGGWLPFFHDMGLISMLLRPIYYETSSYIMNPVEFIKNPISWLQMVSKYKITDCGGPNFGYDLCVSDIEEKNLSNLDLSHWRVAYNGAEPIRSSTIKNFTKKFEKFGFKAESFVPCYGMAEVTLFVSGSQGGVLPVFSNISTEAFEKGLVLESVEDNTKELVSSGILPTGEILKIVNHENLSSCKNNEIGEIWVSGKHIAKGYWNKAELNEQTFNAYISDTKEGPFLRTGDLGFFRDDGELFITGRIKDLIIIRGKNYAPQDIEFVVESCHEAIKKNCSSAFSIEVNNEEVLVVVAEVDKKNIESLDLEILNNLVRRKVSSSIGLQIYDFILINSNTIPRTTSGKIQRNACKKVYLNKKLDIFDLELIKNNLD